MAAGMVAAVSPDTGMYAQQIGLRTNTGDPVLPHFRTESAQVLIPFTAVDKQDRLISGLSVEHVRVLADGKEQHINFLSAEDGPTSVVFVIDISGSMKKPVADVQEAMRRMLHAAADGDEFAVIEFSDRPRLTVDFTSSESRVEERITEISPTGRTSLTDAVVLAFREIRRGHQPRKAVIVISDGYDNHSRYREADAMRMAAETDARVYGIEMYPPMGEAFTPRTFLERLARVTGGRYLPTVNRKDIPSLLEKIDIHHTYVLGFTPPPEHRDGKSHQIDLRLKGPVPRLRATLFWKERYRIPAVVSNGQ
jgi:Ca-activated chloride channel homolog